MFSTQPIKLAILRDIPIKLGVLCDIPFHHHKVDIEDLNQINFKWLSNKKIKFLKKKLLETTLADGGPLPDGRYSKTELVALGIKNPKYAVIKKGNEIYLIYKGKHANKDLGSGAFGTVKLVQNVDSGKTETIKIMKRKPEDKITKIKNSGEREQKNLDIMGQLMTAYWRETKEQFEIVMSLGKGIPVNLLLQNQNLSVVDRLDMALAILQAIQDLHHDYRLIHRDIKPANILYDPITKKATIIDVGIAKVVDENTEALQVQGGWAGTYGYIAVEIEEKLEEGKFNTYNEKTEVYALGKTLSEIFGLELKVLNEAFTHIEDDSKCKEYFKDEQLRKSLKELVLKCTTSYPRKRNTVDSAITLLQNIRNNYCSRPLNVDSLIYNVAYLDVNEYLFASEQQKAELHLALQSADAIQLISSSGEYIPYDFVKVKHALENVGHQVFEKALLNPDTQHILMEEIIEEHAIYVEKSNKTICNPFYFKLFKEGVFDFSDYAKRMEKNKDSILQRAVSEHYLQNTIESLKARKSLLRTKDLKTSLYNDAIAMISKFEGTITYGQLFFQLETLEKQLKTAWKRGIKLFDVSESRNRTKSVNGSKNEGENHVRLFRTKTKGRSQHEDPMKQDTIKISSKISSNAQIKDNKESKVSAEKEKSVAKVNKERK